MKLVARTTLVAAFAIPIAVFAAGCGPSAGPRAKVKGKVSLSGKPLTAGTIAFYGPKERIGSSPIQADGTYEIPDAPVGEVKITVTTPDLNELMGRIQQGKAPPGTGMPADMDPGKKGMITSPSQIVPVPVKYNKVETSGLTYTVTNVEQEHDIDLPP